jgi:hypothetical protein
VVLVVVVELELLLEELVVVVVELELLLEELVVVVEGAGTA